MNVLVILSSGKINEYKDGKEKPGLGQGYSLLQLSEEDILSKHWSKEYP